MSGDAFLVGALQACRAVPTIFITPIAGVMSDRMNRRRILMGTQATLAVLAASFATLVISGYVQVWHLFVFTFLTGSCFAMNNPLRLTMVSNTVPRESLVNATALTSVAFNINRVVGPALGGLLIAFLGPGDNFVIQATCYAASAVMVFGVHTEFAARQKKARQPSPFSDFREGVSYVLHHRPTLAIVVLAFIPTLFVMPFTAGLMPVFSKDVLGQGSAGLGLLLSCYGIGGLTGTLAIASMGNMGGKLVIQAAMGVAAGATLILVSRSTSMSVALPLLAVQGLAQMVFFSMNNTTLQSITPDNVRGRVNSIYMMHLAMVPLGSFLAGTLAGGFGSPLAMLVGGVCSAALVVVAAFIFRGSRDQTT